MPKSRANRKKTKYKPKTSNINKLAPENTELSGGLLLKEVLIELGESLLALIVVILCIATLLFYILPATKVRAFDNIPIIIQTIYIIILLPLALFNFRLADISYKECKKKPKNYKLIHKAGRQQIIFSSLLLTFTVMPALYVYGLTEKIANYLNVYYPSDNSKISETLSWVLTAIISGVIGNLAYAILKLIAKRLFSKK